MTQILHFYKVERNYKWDELMYILKFKSSKQVHSFFEHNVKPSNTLNSLTALVLDENAYALYLKKVSFAQKFTRKEIVDAHGKKLRTYKVDFNLPLDSSEINGRSSNSYSFTEFCNHYNISIFGPKRGAFKRYLRNNLEKVIYFVDEKSQLRFFPNQESAKIAEYFNLNHELSLLSTADYSASVTRRCNNKSVSALG